MESLHDAIKEDLRAAVEAFKVDSFDDVNIFANRIMANAVFGTDEKIFLHGFFLKDVAVTFMVLKTRKEATAYSTAKSHGFGYVGSLEKSFSSFDEENLWEEFHKYYDEVRRFLMSDFEGRSYSNNIEFTRNAFSWLVKYLGEHRDILIDANNFLLKGVLNEMDRIFRVHSGGLPEVALISLIKALDRYYDYFRRVHEKPNGRIDEEKLKKDVFPYIDQLEAVYRQELKISEIDDVLWNLVKGWREFFIQYMELPTARVAFEKGIELPPELKKKLSESLVETLEKKI